MHYGLTKALRLDIEPVFDPDRAGDIKHSNADISKEKEKPGYSSVCIFEKVIKEAIEWYKVSL